MVLYQARFGGALVTHQAHALEAVLRGAKLTGQDSVLQRLEGDAATEFVSSQLQVPAWLQRDPVMSQQPPPPPQLLLDTCMT